MSSVKTDAQIKHEVLRELAWDPRVDETDVGVEVDRGVVTLTGTVATWAKRVAAQEAAHRVAGVLDVANDVVVKIPGTLLRTDTDIAQAVRQALEWDALVPHERIQSTVANGWVTLEGSVDSWASVAELMSIRSACLAAVGAAPVVGGADLVAGAAFCMLPPVAG